MDGEFIKTFFSGQKQDRHIFAFHPGQIVYQKGGPQPYFPGLAAIMGNMQGRAAFLFGQMGGYRKQAGAPLGAGFFRERFDRYNLLSREMTDGFPTIGIIC